MLSNQVGDIFGFDNFFFSLLVRGPLMVVLAIAHIIAWLAGNDVIKDLVSNTQTSKLLPIMIVVGVVLAMVIGGIAVYKGINDDKQQETISLLFNRLLIAAGLILLLPSVFIAVSMALNFIISAIAPNFGHGETLTRMAYCAGFTNGTCPVQTDSNPFPNPNSWGDFNWFIGLFIAWPTALIFLLLSLQLVERILVIAFLYVISPTIAFSSITENGLNKMNVWKDILIGNFLTSLVIVLGLILMQTVDAVFFAALQVSSLNWLEREVALIPIIVGTLLGVLTINMKASAILNTSLANINSIGGLQQLGTLAMATVVPSKFLSKTLLGRKKAQGINKTPLNYTTTGLGRMEKFRTHVSAHRTNLKNNGIIGGAVHAGRTFHSFKKGPSVIDKSK